MAIYHELPIKSAKARDTHRRTDCAGHRVPFPWEGTQYNQQSLQLVHIRHYVRRPARPWQRLYLRPDPQGQRSLRPILVSSVE